MKRIKDILSKIPFKLAILLIIKYFFVKIFNKNIRISYSQCGEDILLRNFFGNKKDGFYVDIGCNHPIDGNNTFNLYLRGWTGINVDGNHKLITLFKKIRRKDISICSLISDSEELLNFYISKQDKVSTVDEVILSKFKNQWQYDVSDMVQLKSTTITKILDENLPINKNIDFLSIDIEGYDMKALLGLDLNKYRPTVICIEMHGFDISNFKTSDITQYLSSNNYSLKHFAIFNGFFFDNQAKLV